MFREKKRNAIVTAEGLKKPFAVEVGAVMD
jgi:hypothetical protein